MIMYCVIMQTFCEKLCKVIKLINLMERLSLSEFEGCLSSIGRVIARN